VKFPTIRSLCFLWVLTLSIPLLGIDKGDFQGLSIENKDKVLDCFDGKAYYLVAEQGNTLVNRWTQTSRIETPPAFTGSISMYVLLFLKPESAQTYVDYYRQRFGKKHVVRDIELPKVFDKLFNSQTNLVLEPDLVITESSKIPPIKPEYFADPQTQKPYSIEVNGNSFIPCFLLNDQAEMFQRRILQKEGKKFVPVAQDFKIFLKFVEDQVKLGNKVRVFGDPAEDRLKKYINSLSSPPPLPPP